MFPLRVCKLCVDVGLKVHVITVTREQVMERAAGFKCQLEKDRY
jgi:hypothetical protein